MKYCEHSIGDATVVPPARTGDPLRYQVKPRTSVSPTREFVNGNCGNVHGFVATERSTWELLQAIWGLGAVDPGSPATGARWRSPPQDTKSPSAVATHSALSASQSHSSAGSVASKIASFSCWDGGNLRQEKF